LYSVDSYEISIFVGQKLSSMSSLQLQSHAHQYFDANFI
jgi:hypothetical protein